MSDLQSLRARRELLANLVSRDLKSRYKGSALGLLWSLLTPLFMAVIYVFFLRLLSRGVPVEQIVVGVFAWNFTVQAVQSGMESITGHTNLVKKVAFPRIFLPLSSTLACLVNYLLSLIVQFAVVGALAWHAGAGLRWAALLVPVVIVWQTLFNLALALLLSASNVYFRDTRHLVGVFISAWFFLSPAMYHLGFVQDVAASSPWVMKLYMLNPMAGIISAYRSLILPGVDFPFNLWTAIGLAWPLLLLAAAVVGFRRSQRNFADML